MFSHAHQFLYGLLLAAQLNPSSSRDKSPFEEILHSRTNLTIVTSMSDFIDREAQLDDEEEEEELEEELAGENGEVRRKPAVNGRKQRDFEDSSEEEDDDDEEEAAEVCLVSR